jgi:hypothetical protein
MTETMLTPSRLWRRMAAEQRHRVARAFWQDEEAAEDQAQAMLLIAQQKKFRPKTVAALDDDRRARHLASLATVPNTIAGRALIAYHLAEHRAMMAAFLDGLGIAHDNGLIKEEHVKPDAAKIPDAVKQLSQKFPEEDVKLYLNTLLCQDPDAWAALREVPAVAGELRPEGMASAAERG